MFELILYKLFMHLLWTNGICIGIKRKNRNISTSKIHTKIHGVNVINLNKLIRWADVYAFGL